VQAIRDAAVAAKRAPATISKTISLLRAIFEVARQDRKFGITVNPAADIIVRGEHGLARPRGIWTLAEIETFRQAHPDGPLRVLLELGLHTGARLGELVGLRPQDIVLAEPAFINILPTLERRLKTPGSTRRVPLVHQAARDAAQEVADGALRGADAQLWSKRFRRARQALGISQGHGGLRHTFKYHWRNCGLPEPEGDAITGHQNGAVARTYGAAAGYPLRPLIASMRLLKFE
jgi:integrase